MLIESKRPSKGFVSFVPVDVAPRCLGSEGARAEGNGEELLLFMTVLGVTGGLGVVSLRTDRGGGGFEKLKADGRSESDMV